MARLWLCFYFLIITIEFIAGANLPNNFKKCKRNDPNLNECLTKAVQDALNSLGKNGLPEFGIFPLEPLAVDNIVIEDDPNAPVRLSQKYSNVKIIGIGDSKLSNFNTNFDENVITSNAFSPKMVMTATYELDGQVLLLPVKGQGFCNITMIDLQTTQKMILEKFEKKGKEYRTVKDYQIVFKPKRAYFNFENLFGGDKRLSQQIHNIVDDNWEAVFNDFKGGYEKSFGLVFKSIANNIFSKIPFDTIFPPN